MYPHAHKEIMTSLIQEMLDEGIICPNTSPFSYLIIFYKKKGWKMTILCGLQSVKRYYRTQPLTNYRMS